jgi:hypothetical protein
MFGRNSESFDEMALKVSAQYGFNLQDVKDTFSGRDETLRNYFNAASSADHRRKGYGLATVFLGAVSAAAVMTLVVPAVTGTAGVYTGYKTYEANKNLNWIGSQIQAEIDKKSAAPASSPAPGPTGS